jgi:hypothetical protein
MNAPQALFELSLEVLSGRFPKSNAGSAAVLVDEFDASRFQGTADSQIVRCGHGGLAIG